MLHFYDGQIRRYITQMIRMLSDFSYKDGSGELRRIPVMYGDITRQVANLLRDNSENKLPSAPRIAMYITGLEIDRERTSDSSFVSKVHVRERAYDEAGKEYLNTQGKNYTVERLMPTPYKLVVNADIWSTNTDQKLQIIEQITMLFNPSLEIQTTDNYVDWASLTVVDLENIVFTNRTIPAGTENQIDISTLTFSTPIWISPPAKVKRLGVITNIIMNVFNENTGNIDLGLSTPELNQYDSSLSGRVDKDNNSVTETTSNIIGADYSENIILGEMYTARDGRSVRIYATDGGTAMPVYGAWWNEETRVWEITTWTRDGKANPESEDPDPLDLLHVNKVNANSATETPTTSEVVAVNYLQLGVYVEGDTIKLMRNNSDKKISWLNIVSSHPGKYTADVSRIFLTRVDLDITVTGTFRVKTIDNSILQVNWDYDSFPSNTVIDGSTNIDYVIEPNRFNPSYVKQPGMRFLILSDIGSVGNQQGPAAWRQTDGTDFFASANDIIEWDGASWSVVFNAASSTGPVYTTNLNTRTQYMWNGSDWVQSIDGEYPVGSWRIELDG